MSQELKGTLNNALNLNGSMQSSGNLRGQFQLGGGGGGTTDYEDLSNKPSINGHTLEGDSDTADLQLDYTDLLNKPDLTDYYTKTETNTLLDGKVDDSQLNPNIISDISDGYQMVTRMVTYPEIRIQRTRIGPYYVQDTIDGMLSEKANTDDLATVATTGDYDDLLNKPNIPDVSDYYTKTETDNLLADKADKTAVPLLGKKVVIHKLHLGSTAVTTSAGSLYVSANKTADISSYGFTSVDACIPMGWNATGTAASWVALQAFSTTDINYLIYRHSSMTFSDYYVSFLIIGD